MANKHDANQEPVDELIEVSSDIAGGAAGAAIGFFAGGPIGAIAGGVAAPVMTRSFRKIASEIKSRFLGPREEKRIGATIAFAAEKIKENLDAGQQLRQDDFFEEQPDGRATSDEILEGILLASQREHEEKKLRYFGNLVANIAFHPEINRAEANLLIKIGDRLSYRQLVLIALFVNKQAFNLRQESYRGYTSFTQAQVALLQEVFDLYSQGLLNGGDEALLGMGDTTPAKMNVQGTGATIFNLMELWKIDVREIEEVAKLLR